MHRQQAVYAIVLYRVHEIRCRIHVAVNRGFTITYRNILRFPLHSRLVIIFAFQTNGYIHGYAFQANGNLLQNTHTAAMETAYNFAGVTVNNSSVFTPLTQDQAAKFLLAYKSAKEMSGVYKLILDKVLFPDVGRAYLHIDPDLGMWMHRTAQVTKQGIETGGLFVTPADMSRLTRAVSAVGRYFARLVADIMLAFNIHRMQQRACATAADMKGVSTHTWQVLRRQFGDAQAFLAVEIDSL